MLQYGEMYKSIDKFWSPDTINKRGETEKPNE